MITMVIDTLYQNRIWFQCGRKCMIFILMISSQNYEYKYNMEIASGYPSKIDGIKRKRENEVKRRK